MNRFWVLLLVILFVPVVPIGFSEEGVRSYGVSHSFPLRIVFVGFDEGVVDTGAVDLNIDTNHYFFYEGYDVVYDFNVSYYFANSSYYSGLKDFILDNSVNGTGATSRLNVTALQLQQSTGTRMSIFLPQSGRAIDAGAVEDWFANNPCVSGVGEGYWFYVMNFSMFDSANHGLEHWYNTSELDFEAGRLRDSWRLEWDNQLNTDVKFPYACFTSQSRVFLIDPSAFQWYLTWARIWWGLSVSGPKYDYYFEDLDEFQSTHNVQTPQGRSDLAYYLAGWIDDAISNMLAPGLWTGLELSNAKSMSIQTLVLNNASDFGYSNEVMSWIINESLAEFALEDLAPFIDVDVEVEFQYLTDIPQLEAIFDNAVLYKEDGWTYYDGEVVWDGLINVRDNYFNFSAADIVINGYVFLEKNMSMMYWGGEYTGLGGSGQILVMKEVGRYYQEDGVSPKTGLGLVFIHEAGHNLGFPHTFIHGVAYASDFSFDVMGYYPYSFFFTKYRKDCFRRLIVDLRTLSLMEQLDNDMVLYGRKNSTGVIDAEFDKIYEQINTSMDVYDELRFLDAYDEVLIGEGMEVELLDRIWIYLCDLVEDGKIDIFDVVLAASAYGSRPGDEKWNPDADLIQDGLIDIFDIVIFAGNYGKTWQ